VPRNAETIDDRGDGPDEASRSAALRIAVWCHAGQELPAADRLHRSGNAREFEAAVLIAERSGRVRV